MDLSKMTPEEARAIVMQAQNVFDASIADQQRTSPKEIQALPLDLTQARTKSNAMKVSFPFKSVLIEQATDLNTFIYLIPISNDSGNDPIRLGLKDIYKNEFGFRECYIYWDAQPSKSILLKFFVRSFLENGRLLLDQNSATDYLSLGAGNAQNDSFTLLAKSAQLNVLGQGVWQINQIMPINDFNFFQSGAYLMTGLPMDAILVPIGYYAELLGAEMTVGSNINSTDLQHFVYGIPYGANITNNSTTGYNTPYMRGEFINQAETVQKNSKVYFQVANLSGGVKKRIIFDENEAIIMGVVNQSSVASPVGNFIMRYMFRFYKKVG